GSQHAELAETEELRTQHLNPQGNRWLVHRDEATRIEGDVKEVMPAVERAADDRGVVGCSPAVLLELPQTQPTGKADREQQADYFCTEEHPPPRTRCGRRFDRSSVVARVCV